MTKVKKIPLRRCTGCGESFPKKELLRVVRTPEGDVVLDRTGKQNGRGAYMCRSTECLKKAKKSGRLSSSLGAALSEEIYDELAAEVADGE